jgi:glycosyltransferase involved in cell wall biosynthesis
MPGFTVCSFVMSVKSLRHNILFLDAVKEDIWGGLENWMMVAGKELSRRGHAVSFGGRADSLFLYRVREKTGLPVHELPISGDFHPVTITKLARLLRRKHIDVVLCSLIRDVRLAWSARLFAQDFSIIWRAGINYTRRTFSHRYFFSSMVDRVIVPCVFLKKALISSGYIPEERFNVIYNGLQPEDWQFPVETSRREILERYGWPDESFICISSGRLAPVKGLKHLIEAAALLTEKDADLRFVIMGDGPEKEHLVAQAHESGLDNIVVFTGRVDTPAEYLAGVDLFVHPSLSDSFPNAVMEAMACGKPVVASRVDGVPELIVDGESGLLVEPGKAAALALAIAELKADENLRLSFGEAARSRVERHFGLNRMIKELEEVIDATCGERVCAS